MSQRPRTAPALDPRPAARAARTLDGRARVRGRRLVGAAVLLTAGWLVAACAGTATDGSGRARREAEPAAPTPAVALESVELRLGLDPGTGSIAGSARLELVAREGRVDWVPLELDGLAVASVRDAEGESLAHSHQDGTLAVRLREPLSTDERVTLTVDYAGRPARGLTFAESATLGGTLAWTEGRPGSAGWWYPTLLDPARRFRARLELELPEGWTAAGFGRRTEPTGEADAAFESVEPLTADELAFAAGPFVVERRAAAGVEIHGAASEREALARAADEAVRSRLFARAFLAGPERALDPAGPLSLVHAPEAARPGSGGRRLGYLSDLALVGVSAAVMEREAAARFTPARYEDAWIGPAVGLQLLAAYVERLGGPEARAEAVERWESGVAADRPSGARGALLPPDEVDPVAAADEPWRASWGALVLELVRGELGAESFAAGLRALALRAESYATGTETLFELLEPAGDADSRLDWRQWVTQPGRPALEVAWEHDEDAGEVRLRVRQTQPGEQGTPRVYRFPVEVEVAAGARVEVHDLTVDERVESFRLPAETRPKWVRFDVEGWLPAEIDERKELAEWFAISADARRSLGRVRAVEALAARAASAPAAERSLYLTHFRGRLDRDPSPRARRAAARALGALGGEAAERWLVDAAAGDADPTVRAAALDALADLADDATTDLVAFAERRAENDPECVAAALRLRAAADPASAVTYLRASFAESAGDPARRAASIAALATLEEPNLESLLIVRAVDPAEPVEVRVAALEGLARYWTASPETIERVGGLLDDPAVRVREAALDTLVGWRGPVSRTVLEARLPRTVDPTERRVIEAGLERPR